MAINCLNFIRRKKNRKKKNRKKKKEGKKPL